MKVFFAKLTDLSSAQLEYLFGRSETVIKLTGLEISSWEISSSVPVA
jgi:hypothetical protein